MNTNTNAAPADETRLRHTDGTRTLEQDVLSAIHDYADTKPEIDPEEPESWESWFVAAFDLLGDRVGRIFEEHAQRANLSTAAQPPTDEEILAAVRPLYSSDAAAKLASDADLRNARMLLALRGAAQPPIDERAAFDRYWLDRQRARGFGGALSDDEMLRHPERREDELHAWQARAKFGVAQPPAGMVMVPVEPTHEQAKAAAHGIQPAHKEPS